MAKRKQWWVGEAPLTCDTCGTEIIDEFSDGKIPGSSWANVCPRCTEKYGITYGTGYGQRYTKQADGKWLKTAG